MYRILMVENAPASAGVDNLSRQLADSGYTVERLDWQAYNNLPDRNADLLMLDSTLPECISACQKLKGSAETELMPVIFYTEQTSGNGKVVQSLKTGAADFLPLASCPPDELLARIQNVLRQKQMLSQSRALTDQLTEMNSELYERNLQVEKELYTARQLQQSLLPPFLPDDEADDAARVAGKTTEHTAITRFSKCHFRNDKLRISGVYMPCDALGGDIYDVIQFPDKTIGVAIADVSGHGVPAGFVTAIFKSSFYRITHNYDVPKDIMFHLNNELANIVKTGEYVTTIYVRIHEDMRTVDFTGAGHPYPVCYKAATDTIERPQENGTPLVWIKDMEYPMGELTLAPGDHILLFTDGISEMRNAEGEMFGEEALEELFKKLIHEEPNNILDGMIRTLSDFTDGHPLEDDLSVVLIEAL